MHYLVKKKIFDNGSNCTCLNLVRNPSNSIYNMQSSELLIKIETNLWKLLEWKCKILMLKIFSSKITQHFVYFGSLINMSGT